MLFYLRFLLDNLPYGRLNSTAKTALNKDVNPPTNPTQKAEKIFSLLCLNVIVCRIIIFLTIYFLLLLL